MDGDFRSKFFVPGSLIIIIGLSVYNVHLFMPSSSPSEPEVVETTAVDPQVTQAALGYLVKAPDVTKVVIQDNQVFIGLAKKPETADLAALVQEAALNYATAIDRDVFAHGTHEQQMPNIGMPGFAEYCGAHAQPGSVLGPEGTMVKQSTIVESNC